MVCGTCGCNNEDASLYCANCGAPLKTDSYGTTVENKYNTQNSFYVQESFDSNKTEELSSAYPQNGSDGQGKTNPQNNAYSQNGINGQRSVYPQNGMNGQGGVYSQNATFPQNNMYPQNGAYPQNGQYPQNGSYPQNNMYPNNGGYPQNGYGVQGNYYAQNGVDDLDSLLGANKAPSNRMKASQFMKLPPLAGVYKKISGSAISIYVLTAISAVFSISQGNYWGILDYILLIILALIIQFKGSLVAAFILLGYGIVNSIICVFEMGFPAGFGFIIAGVYAVIATNKLHKTYKEYVKTGYIPNSTVL
ncbi:zinc ribbon domain-containing protein [Butyrivibrio sp. M55]|uniref:zinc ribbon domain-containing protein n=1 Tax=Butyrivibrio sp. M55 TaxID=1855323 RepID=UPI0008EDC82C|nr:zinc ribbon domain-containing protein [Butyrivibrio sp. M55]SFU79391.1 hypothetical protein SAMN05216540_11068 [Butyrivibrio sp. M55]